MMGDRLIVVERVEFNRLVRVVWSEDGAETIEWFILECCTVGFNDCTMLADEDAPCLSPVRITDQNTGSTGYPELVVHRIFGVDVDNGSSSNRMESGNGWRHTGEHVHWRSHGRVT